MGSLELSNWATALSLARFRSRCPAGPYISQQSKIYFFNIRVFSSF